MNLRDVQRAVMGNRRRQGFNLTDVPLEPCQLQGEAGEAGEADKVDKADKAGEKPADVALYVCGLAGILGIDLTDQFNASSR